jgi:hypothetical protein
MMRIKPNTQLLGLDPPILVAALCAWTVFHEQDALPCIASSTDGHPDSRAELEEHHHAICFDTIHVPSSVADKIGSTLTRRLGPEYRVVKGSTRIHVRHVPPGA